MPKFNVAQLAKHLLDNYPPDMPILVNGYEGDYHDPILEEVEVIQVKKYKEWNGPYKDYSAWGHAGKKKPFKAIVLARPNV